MNNWLSTGFHGTQNYEIMHFGFQTVINVISDQRGIFCGDNLFTYNKNLSFLEDPVFMESFQKHCTNEMDRSLAWRIATVLWGFRRGLTLEGDFVECACYKGVTARVICDNVDFASRTDRHYYLYDLFDHDPTMPHLPMIEQSTQLYGQVRQKFAPFPNVTVTRGRVPDVLAEVSPKKIAFMHLDLNNAESEIGALEVLFDRMVPGAVLVLDDYGWLDYRPQKLAEDPWFLKRGYHVLELPTGQGLVIK
ncbi:MAG: class I SAM-dependent methyltransferase [Beijerinckiaceae bacterium]|nr:class I SAM-dependent methyltransferase [Beijerinckiaceae bacterium]MCZ8299556.1 class I SAM-dependent methyltransferase [Beijerinckiaceae bacterium]